MGDIPEQIVAQLGGYVSLTQVHAALAYYFANKAEDADQRLHNDGWPPDESIPE